MKRLYLLATLLIAGVFSLQAQESENPSPRIFALKCNNMAGLTSLDVSGCTAMTELSCYRNSLTSLDVSDCPALTRLDCYNNQLTSLDVSDCPALTRLDCSYYADYQYYEGLTTLNVSGCTSLTYLSCFGNQLTSLDVSGLSFLETLACSFNQLTSLNVSGLSSLKTLVCSANQLTSLNVSGCTAITYMECQNNQLTNLDVSGLSSLKTLYCGRNHIPLSMLYGIYNQRKTWEWDLFSSANQSDTITLYRCLPWDLSSERMLGETETTFTLKDAAGNDVSAEDYTQNDFVFQFTPPFKGTLILQNKKLKDCEFAYYISVKECFSVSVGGNNEDWGSVSQSGNGTYFQDSLVRITATANEGYRFVNWTKNGEVFGTKADTTFKASESLALVANFELITFTISISSNNEAWGSVSQNGNGTYPKDSLVRITATANEGYRFVNWTKNGEVFGTKADTTFKASESLALVANFELITFTISISSNNEDWGSVSQNGNGTYPKDSLVRITATANEGYRFVNWMNNGEVFGTKADTTFKVTENLVLVAHFEEIPVIVEPFTVSVSVNNPEWGTATISGDGTYEEGSEARITATANEGYRFVNWTKNNGAEFSKEAAHTFAVTENLKLVANFEKPDDVANESFENDNFYVYTQGGMIYLSENVGSVQVYNVTGQCVYNGVATAIPVRHSGVYIVKVGARSYKVVVR